MFRKIKCCILKLTGIESVKNQLSENRRSLHEINWGIIFSFSIKDSVWFKKQKLNPGRWALGFPALYILYRILDDVKPKSILEFGLGESSKLTSQYAQYFKNKLLIIEQDKNWLDHFSQQYHDIGTFVKLVDIEEKIANEEKVIKYKDLMSVIQSDKYDCIIVDGPWGTPTHSRSQIIDIIENDLLAENFIIMMDDANRNGEKDTIKQAGKILDTKDIKYFTGIYSGEKDCVILCSPCYKFILSL